MLAGDRTSPLMTNADSILRAIKNISNEDTLVVLTNNETLARSNEYSFNVEFLTVPNDTLGALATLAFGISRIPEGASFVVVPSNSLVPADELAAFESEMIRTGASVGAIVFEGDSPLYSYARLDKDGQIMEIVEKQVTGSCALAGVFFFSNRKHLSECIKWAMVNNAHLNGRFFVAPALNYFVAQSFGISLFYISKEKYVRL
jgi:hypothetical protein